MWASGGFGRNRNQRGEWNYAIDPDATPKTLDWKAFLGSAPKRPFDPERYFRWRKYWDYSGGIATDLFYHSVSPLLLTVGGEFPLRVTAGGGIYMQKDREVPDTFFMNVDYPAWTMQLACSVGSGMGAPLVVHGSRRDALHGARTAKPDQHADGASCPTASIKDEFVKKTGAEAMKIAVEPFARGAHPHMDNFLECVRSRQEPNLPPSSATRRWPPSAWACRRTAAARSCSSTARGRKLRTNPLRPSGLIEAGVSREREKGEGRTPPCTGSLVRAAGIFCAG